MRIFKLFICFFVLCMLVTGCKQQKVIRYEQVDGDPEIDYIDFLNDTICRFVVPGPLILTCHYAKLGNTYIIQINNMVSARLCKIGEGKLQGEPLFFEGVWTVKEK